MASLLHHKQHKPVCTWCTDRNTTPKALAGISGITSLGLSPRHKVVLHTPDWQGQPEVTAEAWAAERRPGQGLVRHGWLRGVVGLRGRRALVCRVWLLEAWGLCCEGSLGCRSCRGMGLHGVVALTDHDSGSRLDVERCCRQLLHKQQHQPVQPCGLGAFCKPHR